MKILNIEDYKNFLKIANYDPVGIIEENNANLKLVPLEFFEKQVKKFEEGDRTGCCLNFSTYLMAKFSNTRLLMCLDGNKGIHCAVLYEKNGELFVCDPAKAKIENDTNLYFEIPVKEYSFDNPAGDQKYTILPSFSPEKPYSRTMMYEIIKPTNVIKVNSIHDLSDEDIKNIIVDMNQSNIIRENLDDITIIS